MLRKFGLKLYWIIACVIVMNHATAQIKPLTVGDALPDLPIGKTIINTTQITRLSGFSDKLTIIQFWSRTCSSCIEEFKNLTMLRAKFADSLRIVSVTSDTEQQLREWFNKPFAKIVHSPAQVSIIEDTILSALFPHKYAGYFVWIDRNGKVILKGIKQNNSVEKISLAIRGEKIDFIDDTAVYDSRRSLIDDKSATCKMGAVITGFNDQLADPYGEEVTGVVDSICGTVRTTILNEDVPGLYLKCCGNELDRSWSNVWHNERSVLPVYIDLPASFPYAHRLLPRERYTDEWMKQNLYCYEQVLPLNEKDSADTYMLRDLNRFFGNALNIEARVENRTIKGLSLVPVADMPKQSIHEDYKEIRLTSRRRTIVRLQNADIRTIIMRMGGDVLKDLYVFNDTGINYGLDITFEENIQTIDDFNKQLSRYNLKLIESNRTVKVLSIKQK